MFQKVFNGEFIERLNLSEYFQFNVSNCLKNLSFPKLPHSQNWYENQMEFLFLYNFFIIKIKLGTI